MGYEKQTWANGEVITDTKLNHMEDGIASCGGLQKVAHLSLYNKYQLTFNSGMNISTGDFTYYDLDASEPTEVDITTLPDFDFIVIESVSAIAYDGNGAEIRPVYLVRYQMSKAEEGSDYPIDASITVSSAVSTAKTCPAGSWTVAAISLYKA